MRLSVAVSVMTIAFGALVSSSASAVEPDITSLSWLTGCWRAESGDSGSGEHWLPPAGGTMFGVSRTVKAGKTVEFEFIQLRANAEGKLVFIALPSGQKETTFVATQVGEQSVTFENPQHDFPQKVSYGLQADGRLVARIEGTRAGTVRSIDFPMKRVACETLAGGNSGSDRRQ